MNRCHSSGVCVCVYARAHMHFCTCIQVYLCVSAYSQNRKRRGSGQWRAGQRIVPSYDLSRFQRWPTRSKASPNLPRINPPMFIEYNQQPSIVWGTRDTEGNGTGLRPGLREAHGAVGSTGDRCISMQQWNGELGGLHQRTSPVWGIREASLRKHNLRGQQERGNITRKVTGVQDKGPKPL